MPKFRPLMNNACGCPAVSTALLPLVTNCVTSEEPGGRGRIRTFVARKERQIYSLLVLATHPPVPVLASQVFKLQNPKSGGTQTRVPKSFCCNAPSGFVLTRHKKIESTETQKGLVSKDTSPFNFNYRNCSASLPADFWWSWRRELNPRPSDYKSDALPAELRQRRSNRVRIADTAQKLQGAVERRSTVRASVVEKPGTGFQVQVRTKSFTIKRLQRTK
jgi:hypothetical protein